MRVFCLPVLIKTGYTDRFGHRAAKACDNCPDISSRGPTGTKRS